MTLFSTFRPCLVLGEMVFTLKYVCFTLRKHDVVETETLVNLRRSKHIS